MTPTEFVEIVRQGIFVLLIIGAPPMLISLAVGLIISLFQALTQIQEATLTFVPKIITMLLTLIIMMPFMLARLIDFTHGLMDRVAHIQ
ncbi:MAG: flagellar biosynthesis protein FliQ [Alphaproteobacteria bacterium]|nr:flagellar biosynthesis protein FliQ [Alphaproteobacteria bacterium]